MPASASALVERSVQRGLATLTKQAGFRRSANNWSRTLPSGVVEIANIQGSQSNTSGQAKFTLNLGVYLPILVEILETRVVSSPKHYDCQLRTRIGHLIDRGDWWWLARAEREADDAGDQLAELWVNTALPWFGAVSNPAGALNWLEASDFAFHGPVIGAGLALALDQSDRARAIVDAHRDEMTPPRLAWAIDHGLASG